MRNAALVGAAVFVIVNPKGAAKVTVGAAFAAGATYLHCGGFNPELSPWRTEPIAMKKRVATTTTRK